MERRPGAAWTLATAVTASRSPPARVVPARRRTRRARRRSGTARHRESHPAAPRAPPGPPWHYRGKRPLELTGGNVDLRDPADGLYVRFGVELDRVAGRADAEGRVGVWVGTGQQDRVARRRERVGVPLECQDRIRPPCCQSVRDCRPHEPSSGVGLLTGRLVRALLAAREHRLLLEQGHLALRRTTRVKTRRLRSPQAERAVGIHQSFSNRKAHECSGGNRVSVTLPLWNQRSLGCTWRASHRPLAREPERCRDGSESCGGRWPPKMRRLRRSSERRDHVI